VTLLFVTVSCNSRQTCVVTRVSRDALAQPTGGWCRLLLLLLLQMKKSVPRLLNRLLGLTLPEQRMAFGYFQVRSSVIVPIILMSWCTS
jgi:hypothetical protein